MWEESVCSSEYTASSLTVTLSSQLPPVFWAVSPSVMILVVEAGYIRWSGFCSIKICPVSASITT